MRVRCTFRSLRSLVRHRSWFTAVLVLAASVSPLVKAAAPKPAIQDAAIQDTVSPPGPTAQPGVPFKADKLATLLPATVYFQGRTANLQLRNAGGTAFGGNAIVWAALVDASGYASNVQERYQFYLVTETPLQIGDAQLAAGVYGAGFVGQRFVIMDIGGHTVAQGSTQLDQILPHPRPLQMLPESADAVKLYLGRRWVTLHVGQGR